MKKKYRLPETAVKHLQHDPNNLDKNSGLGSIEPDPDSKLDDEPVEIDIFERVFPGEIDDMSLNKTLDLTIPVYDIITDDLSTKKSAIRKYAEKKSTSDYVINKSKSVLDIVSYEKNEIKKKIKNGQKYVFFDEKPKVTKTYRTELVMDYKKKK